MSAQALPQESPDERTDIRRVLQMGNAVRAERIDRWKY